MVPHSLDRPGNPYLRRRLSTFDLLVLTILDQLLLILQTLFKFFTKQANFMRRSTVLSLHLHISVPWIDSQPSPKY